MKMNDETNCSFAEYAPEHIANIVERTKNIVKDVRCSIGLSDESKRVLLAEAFDNLKYLCDVMNDSQDILKVGGVMFRMYSDKFDGSVPEGFSPFDESKQ